MRSNRRLTAVVFILFIFVNSYAQDDMPDIGRMDIKAEFAVGFNYDFLRSPLDVSFDYPKGYLGMNIPLKYSMPQSLAKQLGSDLAGQFADSSASGDFIPEAYATQNPNFSISVDVPMMGGVASFSNMQMMYMRYLNKIGIPKLEMKPETGGGVDLFMRGIISVPIDLSIGWETMTFGYAYEVNDMLKFAFNLHRHKFSFDLKGKVDVDILGNFAVTVSEEGVGNYTIGGDVNYSLHNVIDGHYELERWTPSFAIKYWRATLISRFGMNARASGYLKAQYTLPFFIDAETFALDNGLMDGISDPDMLLEYMNTNNNLDKFRNSATNTVEYSTKKNLVWKMPQAHTIMFDIIPDKLSLSYTKLFGSLCLELSDPFSDKAALTDTSEYPDTLDFRFEASIDHVIMIHGKIYNSFINVGIFSMDFAFRDNDNLLSSIKALEKLKFGDGIMAPVLNLGAYVGTKLQLLAELDVLPLLALKTGIVYYF